MIIVTISGTLLHFIQYMSLTLKAIDNVQLIMYNVKAFIAYKLFLELLSTNYTHFLEVWQ
jgi:hypothetical protein